MKRKTYYILDAEGKLQNISSVNQTNAERQAVKKFPGYSAIFESAEKGDVIMFRQGSDKETYWKVKETGPFVVYCYNNGMVKESGSEQVFLQEMLSDTLKNGIEHEVLHVNDCDAYKYISPKENDSCYLKYDLPKGPCVIRNILVGMVSHDSGEKHIVNRDPSGKYRETCYLLEKDGSFFLERIRNTVMTKDGKPFVIYSCHHNMVKNDDGSIFLLEAGPREEKEYWVKKYQVFQIADAASHKGSYVRYLTQREDMSYNSISENRFYSEDIDDVVFRSEYDLTDFRILKKDPAKRSNLCTPSAALAEQWETNTKKLEAEYIDGKIRQLKNQAEGLCLRNDVSSISNWKIRGSFRNWMFLYKDEKLSEEICCPEEDAVFVFADGSRVCMSYQEMEKRWRADLLSEGCAPLSITGYDPEKEECKNGDVVCIHAKFCGFYTRNHSKRHQ